MKIQQKRRILPKLWGWICLLLCLSMGMAGCYSRSELAYYGDRANYISATGIVDHIAYTEDGEALYLAFSDLNPGFEDTNFRVVGESLQLARQNGIDEKVELGDEVVFMAAPKYLGDGYVIPIVEIVVDGEILLPFEEGFQNLQDWLRE